MSIIVRISEVDQDPHGEVIEQGPITAEKRRRLTELFEEDGLPAEQIAQMLDECDQYRLIQRPEGKYLQLGTKGGWVN